MSEDDRPFACTQPGCGMRFTNEDHMSVHRKKHDMSLNVGGLFGGAKGASNIFVDQTPTPTKFLRNCEEIGLFSDLNKNPFEEAFKKASQDHPSNTASPVTSSTSGFGNLVSPSGHPTPVGLPGPLTSKLHKYDPLSSHSSQLTPNGSDQINDGTSDDTAIDLRVSSSSSAEETPPILPPSLLAKNDIDTSAIPTIHIQAASSTRKRAQITSVSDENLIGHKVVEQRQRDFVDHKIEHRRSTIEGMVSSSVMGEPPAKQPRVIEDSTSLQRPTSLPLATPLSKTSGSVSAGDSAEPMVTEIAPLLSIKASPIGTPTSVIKPLMPASQLPATIISANIVNPTPIQPKPDPHNPHQSYTSQTTPGLTPGQGSQPCVMQVVIQMPDGQTIPVQIPAMANTPTPTGTVSQVPGVRNIPGIPGPHTGASSIAYSDSGSASTGSTDITEKTESSSLRTKQLLKSAITQNRQLQQQSATSALLTKNSPSTGSLSQLHSGSSLPPPTLQPSSLQPSSLQPSSLQPSSLQPSSLQPSNLQVTPSLSMPTLRAASISPTQSTSSISPSGSYVDVQDADTSTYLGRRPRKTSESDDPDERRRKFLERNRAAAQRCRQKRKVWVNTLESKADNITTQNYRLQNECNALKGEVAKLKALLLQHKNCDIFIQQRNSGHIQMDNTNTNVLLRRTSNNLISLAPVGAGPTAAVPGEERAIIVTGGLQELQTPGSMSNLQASTITGATTASSGNMVVLTSKVQTTQRTIVQSVPQKISIKPEVCTIHPVQQQGTNVYIATTQPSALDNNMEDSKLITITPSNMTPSGITPSGITPAGITPTRHNSVSSMLDANTISTSTAAGVIQT